MEHSQGFLKLVNDAKSRIKETTPERVLERQKSGHDFYFVDVREDDEWRQGHAAGAIHLGKGIIERDIEKTIPEPGAEIILYCGGGYRFRPCCRYASKDGLQESRVDGRRVEALARTRLSDRAGLKLSAGSRRPETKKRRT